ncbi:helix-turn-helix domain-containing protein [Halorussus halophilus]|uniref:helix-turn-helix domain-containing protein n=1 Tax=Halorussus halophilus TaxID=2650975 RepID=UPI00130166EF|nr:helix-turn-helix domain-containing protein [Halorussus halophilus]
MGTDGIERGVFECSACGNVAFGDPSSTCCDEQMAAVEATPVKEPALALVLRDVFGISKTGLSVCICLMERQEATAADLADELDIDRSTVGRQLNHLTDIGILEKRQRLLREGGYVHVYSPVPVEEVQERLKIGLYAWADEAMGLVEEINREKVAALAAMDADPDDESPASIYWDE